MRHRTFEGLVDEVRGFVEGELEEKPRELVILLRMRLRDLGVRPPDLPTRIGYESVRAWGRAAHDLCLPGTPIAAALEDLGRWPGHDDEQDWNYRETYDEMVSILCAAWGLEPSGYDPAAGAALLHAYGAMLLAPRGVSVGPHGRVAIVGASGARILDPSLRKLGEVSPAMWPCVFHGPSAWLGDRWYAAGVHLPSSLRRTSQQGTFWLDVPGAAFGSALTTGELPAASCVGLAAFPDGEGLAILGLDTYGTIDDGVAPTLRETALAKGLATSPLCVVDDEWFAFAQRDKLLFRPRHGTRRKKPQALPLQAAALVPHAGGFAIAGHLGHLGPARAARIDAGGAVRWDVALPEELVSHAICAGDLLLVLQRQTLTALDLATGALVWTAPEAGSEGRMALLADGRVLAVGRERLVVVGAGGPIGSVPPTDWA